MELQQSVAESDVKWNGEPLPVQLFSKGWTEKDSKVLQLVPDLPPQVEALIQSPGCKDSLWAKAELLLSTAAEGAAVVLGGGVARLFGMIAMVKG